MIELNKEYPQDGEQAIFDRLVTLTREQMREHDGHLRRGQHAKSTGCVEAEFVVDRTVREEFRKGVFKHPGATFRALVRFSNSKGTFERDREGTARGVAIKLFDVEGARAVPHQADRSQDFLMVNHPVFPFSDPADYLAAIKLRGLPIIGDIPRLDELPALAHLLLKDREALATIREIKSKKVVSPLEITYWSGSPYWLGEPDGSVGHAVKYSLVPRPEPTEPPADLSDESDDYLREALVDHLTKREGVFDFKVQLQTDPDRMKVEDASSLWKEEGKGGSVPEAVATVRIPRQDAAQIKAAMERCERLSFNPWHALAEHRPMGGINRLRRAVYEASVAKRSGS